MDRKKFRPRTELEKMIAIYRKAGVSLDESVQKALEALRERDDAQRP